MEEVDKILIHALKQVGTEVPEEINSVKQFSSELIVEAVVRCIRVIDPGLSSTLATSLPPGMSARFRVGMSLAQACQDIGYKGEIGYQTFLYSSEPEIRSLLMFLVEKLPRESAETSDQPTGKSVVLQRTIAAAIKAHLAVPWLPPKCRLPLNCETQRQGVMHSFHVQPLSLTNCTKGSSKKHTKGTPTVHTHTVWLCAVFAEVKDYQRDVLSPVTAQISSQASVVASILEQHTAEISAAQEWDSEWNNQGLLSRFTPQEYCLRKFTRLHKRIEDQLRSAALPSSHSAFGVSRSTSDLCELLQAFKGSVQPGHILTKGTHFTHTQKFNFTQVESSEVPPVAKTIPTNHQSEGDVQLGQQEELAYLQQQFQQLCSEVDHLAADMKDGYRLGFIRYRCQTGTFETVLKPVLKEWRTQNWSKNLTCSAVFL
uniref:Coiled-coil domain-containing protein 22 n=1 Tax=Oreochromis niloticus TaxID=8128 RepID=A0A669AYG2_ORENI